VAYHPRDRWPWNKQMSRRDLLKYTAGGVVMAQFLAACSSDSPTSGSSSASGIAIGTPENPVEQPLFDDNPAIESGLERESGPLRVYNWDAYIWAPVIKDFEEEFGVDVELTTFYNLEEATRKLRTGEVSFDVFFPTSEIVPKFVAGKLLQPLNLDYIPNLEQNVGPGLRDPHYDLGSRYTVPYVLYQTGIGWRSDLVDEDIGERENPWDVFWDPKYKDVVGFYDDYRETISAGMFRNGDDEGVNGADPDILGAARDGFIELIDLVNIRYTIDGAYSKIPEGKMHIHHAWSGDMIGAQYYFPKGGDPNTLRFVWPPKTSSGAGGFISNDCLGVLKGAESPVLAHEFLNFMLSEKYAMKNFSWLGYQPPLKNIEPAKLVADGLVPAPLENALLLEGDYEFGQTPVQLDPTEDRAWLEAWSSIQSGG
jgi:spermidine/putrescine transport system substrate-binding protein